MLLHTPLYLLFLIPVVLLYWRLPQAAGRKALLLAASVFFFAALDLGSTALLIAVTAFTYGIGRILPASPRPRLLAGLGIAANLMVLAAFKYTGFFLAPLQTALRGMGIDLPVSLRLLFPIGLSFYTFQAIAYLLEVYRRKIPPAVDVVDFSLYLAFFPKLIAGPLVRPADFLRQLAEPARSISRVEVQAAAQLFLVGLFKKVVVADSLAALADISFRAAGSPGAGLFPAPLYWSGVYLDAFKIYADFSGYTDIARASAACFGFQIPQNFQQPYFSVSPGDFWNRWHMTLTQWFREYVFFPISRLGLRWKGFVDSRIIQIIATFTTMIGIGLWHGAAWTYLAWGAWHGALISIDRWINFRPARRGQILLAGILTFHLIGIGWIIFRASSLSEALRFLQGMISLRGLVWSGQYLIPAACAGILILGMDYAGRLPARLQPVLLAIRPFLNAAALIAVGGLWILQASARTNTSPFIYGFF